jgi:hypothetical protein
MNDLSICKIVTQWGLNDSCGTDAFLVEPWPVVIQTFSLLSFKLTSGAVSQMRCPVYVDLTYSVSDYFTEVLAKTYNKLRQIFLFS